MPASLSLRRITADGRYIPEIDGLRFVAIASVVLYHICLQWTGSSTAGGSVTPRPQVVHVLLHLERGVPIFFCISGLILGLPFARYHLCHGPQVCFSSYLLRRITRIEPPYLINQLLRFPLFLLVFHPGMRVAMRHLFASFFYLHGILYGTRPIIHPPSWSLEIEVQFYVLAPWIAAIVFRAQRPWLRRSLLLLAIAAASGLALQLSPIAHPRLALTLAAHLAPFLSGLLLADLYLNVFSTLPESWIWDLVSVPLWSAVFLVSNQAAILLLPFLVLALVPAAFRGRLLRPFFRLPAISTTGGMCYSLYLTHSLVLQICFFALARTALVAGSLTHLLAGVLLSVPAVLAVGTVYFVLIERPCMDRTWPVRLHAQLTTWFSRHPRTTPTAASKVRHLPFKS